MMRPLVEFGIRWGLRGSIAFLAVLAVCGWRGWRVPRPPVVDVALARIVRPEPERARPLPEDDDRTPSPILVVAVVAAVVAAVEIAWIWAHRPFGTLNGDEARYVAAAFQYHRSMSFEAHPEVFLWFGPLVPLLSAVALFVGPMDPRTALTVQPLLAAVCAVGVAGMVAPLAGRRSAIVAGVVTAMLPGLVVSTQVYMLAMGSAAVIAGACWALVASDRGARWPIWLVGPLFGLTVASRGMSLVLLPGAALAVLYVCSTSLRGLRRAAGSLALCGVVACGFLTIAPNVTNYLIGGTVETKPWTFDKIGPALTARWEGFRFGVGTPIVLALFALVVGAIWARYRGGESTTDRPTEDRPTARRRPVQAGLLIFVGVGLLGMLSTPENYTWDFFEVPLLPPLIAAVTIATVGALPVLRQVVAVWSVVSAVAMFAVLSWWAGPQAPGAEWALGHYRVSYFEVFNGRDPRFDTNRRAEEPAAAREWWDATRRLDSTLREIDASTPGGIEVVYSATYVSYEPFSAQTVAALENLPGINQVGFDVLGTPRDRWDEALQPIDPSATRVLVIPEITMVASEDGHTEAQLDGFRQYPQVAAMDDLVEYAEDNGWTVAARVPIPLGDHFLVLVP